MSTLKLDFHINNKLIFEAIENKAVPTHTYSLRTMPKPSKNTLFSLWEKILTSHICCVQLIKINVTTMRNSWKKTLLSTLFKHSISYFFSALYKNWGLDTQCVSNFQILQPKSQSIYVLSYWMQLFLENRAKWNLKN